MSEVTSEVIPPKPKKRNVWLWGCVLILLIGICIVLLTAGGGAAYVYLNPTSTSTVTNTPTNTPTSTLNYTETQQAYINATLTAQVPFTQTAAIKTATFQAYLDSIATRNVEKTATLKALQLLLNQFFADLDAREIPDLSFLDPPIFGPNHGSLPHKVENGFIETFPAGVNLNNFVTQIVFHAPYAASRGRWDMGFLFRYSHSPQQYFHLAIDSDGDWGIDIYIDGEYSFIERGSTISHTTVGQTNEILLVAYDNEGWLFLNGNFIAHLNLGDWMGTGDVMASTGLWSGHEINGETTRFSEYTVWKIP